MEQLEEAILSPYRRKAESEGENEEGVTERPVSAAAKEEQERSFVKSGKSPEFLVSLESPEGLSVAAAAPGGGRYLSGQHRL